MNDTKQDQPPKEASKYWADMYFNMLATAQANGFESLTDAITEARTAKAALAESRKDVEFIRAQLLEATKRAGNNALAYAEVKRELDAARIEMAALKADNAALGERLRVTREIAQEYLDATSTRLPNGDTEYPGPLLVKARLEELERLREQVKRLEAKHDADYEETKRSAFQAAEFTARADESALRSRVSTLEGLARRLMRDSPTWKHDGTPDERSRWEATLAEYGEVMRGVLTAPSKQS